MILIAKIPTLYEKLHEPGKNDKYGIDDQPLIDFPKYETCIANETILYFKYIEIVYTNYT